MPKYYSIRVVQADNAVQAEEKIIEGDFEDFDEESDVIVEAKSVVFKSNLTKAKMCYRKCYCGSKEFWVFKSVMHESEIDEDRLKISPKRWDNETTKITCKKCSRDYSPSLFTIEYL